MRASVEFEGEMRQADTPDWQPLLEAVGDDLTADFMWMFEVELSNGTLLQAYTHIGTRRYLHLAPEGAAFTYEPADSYKLLPNVDLRRIGQAWREFAPSTPR